MIEDITNTSRVNASRRLVIFNIIALSALDAGNKQVRVKNYLVNISCYLSSILMMFGILRIVYDAWA